MLQSSIIDSSIMTNVPLKWKMLKTGKIRRKGEEVYKTLYFLLIFLFPVNLKQFYLFIYFWLHWVLFVPCRISHCSVLVPEFKSSVDPQHVGVLVSWPGIEPLSPAWEGRFLTHGPSGKSLNYFRNLLIF